CRLRSAFEASRRAGGRRKLARKSTLAWRCREVNVSACGLSQRDIHCSSAAACQQTPASAQVRQAGLTCLIAWAFFDRRRTKSAQMLLISRTCALLAGRLGGTVRSRVGG